MVRSHANAVNGYWLGEQAAKLSLRMQFERNRDPLMAAQLDDMTKSEAARRRALSEKTASATPAKRKVDKPAPALKPPAYMRGGQSHALAPSPVGASPAQSDGSLKAQRDAAFASAAKAQARASPENAQTVNDGISRAYNAHSHTPSQNP